MSMAVYVIIGFVFVATLVGTILIGKSENDKIKKYEQEGVTAKDELERSWEYETSSLKKNVPSLFIIYSIAIVGSLIALALYIF
ncbi:hypothetical protein E3U55_16200 [Filobacillus milosensis]|uniref:Uncharacterized protein n=1 Tax=Filobacillus milosensis TaxID=94137 RepID=A0A4Y8IE28_9BACI|nr:hypothetical protein [Filobacillus milosensis]TFB13382.1 hypothetical protein E3U55_16200 [Filobacillus milosensis]